MPHASSLSQVSGATACRRAEETPGEGEKRERNQLRVGNMRVTVSGLGVGG